MDITKKFSLFFSAILGLMLFSGASYADCNDTIDVNITAPDEGSTTNSSILLRARSTPNIVGVNCQYTLDNSANSYMMLRRPGGYIHNVTIDNISPGPHTIYVDCVKVHAGCTHTANTSVSWNVHENVAIPEFPAAAIPALISLASFGIIRSMRAASA